MAVYPIRVDLDELKPLSEIGSRELTTWNGVRNKSLKARHITDGLMQIDKKHVVDDELFDKLTERKSDDKISNERIKGLIDTLKDEDQTDAEVLGQRKATKLAMKTVKSKWVAVIQYGDEYVLADAQAVEMAQRLVGESADLKVGPSRVLTWWKYGVPVAAVATWKYFDVEIKDE